MPSSALTFTVTCSFRKGQNRLRISREFRSSEARKARGAESRRRLYLEAQRESVYGRGARIIYYSVGKSRAPNPHVPPSPRPRVDALATKLSSKDELSAASRASRSGSFAEQQIRCSSRGSPGADWTRDTKRAGTGEVIASKLEN